MVYPIVILAIENDEDRHFMQLLYEDYHRLMYFVARKVCQNGDIDDAVNDACISLIQNIHTLRKLDRNKLRSYIVSTTRNACYDILRKQNLRNKHSFYESENILRSVEAQGHGVDSNLIRDAEETELIAGLRQLNERDRRILEMKYFLQMSNDRIAAHLGIKESSVHTYIWLARGRLADVLAGRDHA